MDKIIRLQNGSLISLENTSKNFQENLKNSQRINQIKIAATFLPDAILTWHNGNTNGLETYGIFLYIEIYGVSLLIERHNSVAGGVSKLSLFLKYYYGSIIEALTFYGGDVLTYNGNFMVALFKCMPHLSIKDLMHKAIESSLLILTYLRDYNTGYNSKLDLKIIISCGNVQLKVFETTDHHFLCFSGEPAMEARHTVNLIKTGDLVVTRSAYDSLYKKRYEIGKLEDDYVKITKVNYSSMTNRAKEICVKKYMQCQQLLDLHTVYKEKHMKLRRGEDIAENFAYKRFVSTLPKRVNISHYSKNCNLEWLLKFLQIPVRDCVTNLQSIDFLEQTNEITLTVINMKFRHILDIFGGYLEIIFKIFLDCIREYDGTITLVEVYEIDILVHIIFGLTCSKEENGFRALNCSWKVKNFLKKVSEIEFTSISVITGSLYIGIIGHPHRRRFLSLGRYNNVAERICQVYPDKIVCDYRTFEITHLASYYFKILPQNLVLLRDITYLFEFDMMKEYAIPYSELENIKLVGRNNIFNMAIAILNGTERVFRYRGICMYGTRGIGKTALLKNIINTTAACDQYIVAAMDLIQTCNLPYFTISRIYETFYNYIGSNFEILPELSIPRNILSFVEMNTKEDIALRKYRVLNYFRDLVTCCAYKAVPVIFIDNIEHIDTLSWEIIQIVLSDKKMKLICTATFSEPNCDLRFSISINDDIKLQEILPLTPEQIQDLVCSALDIGGISKILIDSIYSTSLGRPAFTKTYLLKLIQMNQINIISSEENTEDELVFQKTKYKDFRIVPVAVINDQSGFDLLPGGINDIFKEYFLSLDTFQQLIIKSASVLGQMFTRSSLIVLLNFPDENKLIQSILYFFDLGIFRCGSRLGYANSIFCKSRQVCYCYFSEEYFQSHTIRPKYAYCKLIYFKNEHLMKIAYSELQADQRKNMHIICTEYIENSIYVCPTCMKSPLFSQINIIKYDVVINWLQGKGNYNVSNIYLDNSDEKIKDVIKKHIKRLNVEKQKDICVQFEYPPAIDALNCKCIEMYIKVCYDLIYHSKKADHISKRIFFLNMTGILNITLHDLVSARPLFLKATELANVNAKTPYCRLSERFRKYMLGKAHLGLFEIKLYLQKLTSAKNHLAIALRQYDMPSVIFHYKTFRHFLTRTLLKRQKQPLKRWYNYKDHLINCDLARALTLAARLFYFIGDNKLSEEIIKYSVILYTNLNSNIPVLTDHFCSAIDFYRNFTDIHTCIKIEKQAVRNLQNLYGDGTILPIFSVLTLVQTLFDHESQRGKISTALRLGYRWIDFSFRFYALSIDPHSLITLGNLLIYAYRLNEAYQLFDKYFRYLPGVERSTTYYIFPLVFYIRTGFTLIPIATITRFAQDYYRHKGKFSRYFDIILSLYLRIYYLRLNQHENEEWYTINFPLNTKTCRNPMVLQILLLTLEIKLYHLKRYNPFTRLLIKEYSNDVRKLFELAKNFCKNTYRIFLGWYYILKGWYGYIMGESKARYEVAFNLAYDLANHQENCYFRCLILQTKVNWHLGITKDYHLSPVLYAKDANFYSPEECMAALYTFPHELS